MMNRTFTSATLFLTLFISSTIVATAAPEPSMASGFSQIPETGFESGLTGWTPSSALSGTPSLITDSGSGVGLIQSQVTFSASAYVEDSCAPVVDAANWTFGPFGTKSAILQPAGDTFDSATVALGLQSADNLAIKQVIVEQAASSGCGGGTDPTDAAWITKEVSLTAGLTYRMAWNYIGTDYVPFNDGSITSLVPANGHDTVPVVTVNNQVGNYALLGFTNPGTGDYSTGHFGSTGWQFSTYQVSVTGSYLLGFAVFNISDTSLDPVLLVDDGLGSVTRNDVAFGAVAPNNPLAPSLAESSPPAPTLESPTAGLASTGPGEAANQTLAIAILLSLFGLALIFYARFSPQGKKRPRLYWEGN
jgi:fibronectin-binding autotransporter adhesin